MYPITGYDVNVEERSPVALSILLRTIAPTQSPCHKVRDSFACVTVLTHLALSGDCMAVLMVVVSSPS